MPPPRIGGPAFLLAGPNPRALREISASANMTAPGGADTLTMVRPVASFVLGTPASLTGSELAVLARPRPTCIYLLAWPYRTAAMRPLTNVT
jgi:hypothetical protein